MKKELVSLDKKHNYLALLAPSFACEFDYPALVLQLRALGFDKIVELTFGAKLVNKEYHKILQKSKTLKISSVCPGIVHIIKSKFPEYEKNLMKVDSPMIATAKLCKKFYPKHKTVFISPCNFKKLEAIDCIFVDYVIDYKQLKVLLESKGLNEKFCSAKECPDFDLFYNNYTKIYPLAGGLSKTAHLKGVLKRGEEKIIDGISEVEGFLKNPSKNIRFLDANFCKGGCIGGPFLNRGTLADRKKRILDYLKLSNKEKLSPSKKGNILRAKGISFSIK